MLPGDPFQYIAFLVPSLFWLPCRPPLPLFNGFSLSDSSLVSLWSTSSQPAWSAVSDIPSLTSSCPFVHPCLSASKYQTAHLSETSSGPLGQGKTLSPDHWDLSLLSFPSTLIVSMGHLSVVHCVMFYLSFPNKTEKSFRIGAMPLLA